MRAARLVDRIGLDQFRAAFLRVGDGTGQKFTQAKFGDTKGSAYGFALGDMNADTFPDIALARSGAPNVLYLSGK